MFPSLEADLAFAHLRDTTPACVANLSWTKTWEDK